MFVRFRQTARSLQLSLVETHRLGGKVRHEHVASLGSISSQPTSADCIAFWIKLHQRLAALSNRINAHAHGAILGAIHARVPMPTPTDQQAAQVAIAAADVRFWEAISEGHAAEVEDRKAVVAGMERVISDRQAKAVAAAERAKTAQERLARAKRGETVAGISKPLTRKDLVEATGWKAGDFRHAERLIEIDRVGAHGELMADIMKRQGRVEKAAARAILRSRRR